MSMEDPGIKFGIASVNRLFEGKTIVTENKPINLCVVGADGTGKSVLTLHLASHYCHDHWQHESGPIVFYVSTDLNYERASRIWTRFGLNAPEQRCRDPFEFSLSRSPLVLSESLKIKDY